MAGAFSSAFSDAFDVDAGGGTVTASYLMLLGVGCVGWAVVVMPTFYLEGVG